MSAVNLRVPGSTSTAGSNLASKSHSRTPSSASQTHQDQHLQVFPRSGGKDASGSSLQITRANTNTNSNSRFSNRLSRTNTGDTGNPPPSMYNESIRTVDKLPSVKPTVTYMDQLWTQIDVLDDVKKMSEEVRERGSFFNEQFDKELAGLKQSQNHLLQVMARQHFSSASEDAQKRQLYRLNTMGSNDSLGKAGPNDSGKNKEDLKQANDEAEEIEGAKQEMAGDHGDLNRMKRKVDKMNQFFNDVDKDGENHMLYRKTNFSELNDYVEDIRANLQQVGESMKRFDATTKDLW